MLEKQILKEVAEKLTEKPVLIQLKRVPKPGLESWVSRNPRIQRFLNRFGLFTFSKSIVVNALTMGTLYRISALINELSLSDFKGKDFNNWLFSTIEANALKLAEILAAAIHNQKTEVPDQLIDWLFNNLTAKDFAKAMEALKDNIDIENFTNTIVSVSSVNILRAEETSQVDTREKIALGRGSVPQ